MEEIQPIPELIRVRIHKDGKSAIDINCTDKEKKYRIQDVMLGSGPNRRPVPYTDGFLSSGYECLAKVMENGRLRII